MSDYKIKGLENLDKSTSGALRFNNITSITDIEKFDNGIEPYTEGLYWDELPFIGVARIKRINDALVKIGHKELKRIPEEHIKQIDLPKVLYKADRMTITKVIKHLKKEYEKAKTLTWIRKPLSCALYQTWKWCDLNEQLKE